MEHTKYDRPSLHSTSPSTRALGRIAAIMDQHIDAVHIDIKDRYGAIGFFDFKCDLCGFDIVAELHRLYPGDNPCPE